MKYKFSKYNLFVKYDKQYIIFNTLTLSLILLECEFVNMIKKEAVDDFLQSFSEKEIIDLLDAGIILEKEIDEMKIIKDRYWFNKYKDETLHVSVLTTLGCNFCCPYCFETRRNVKITPKTEEAIINFIKEQSKDKKAIHIDWYGGEPLLNFQSIKNISDKLIDYSKKNNIKYYSSVTTNGFLLTEDIVEKLVELKVISAQITLDGTKAIHDKMRPLNNGGGTFDVIIENIKKATKKLKINIRVNLNKENSIYIEDLLKELVGIKNICVALKAIVPASYKNYQEKTLEAKEYAKMVVEKYFYAQRIGMKTAIDNLFTGSVYRYCIVDSDSQFIISPTGKLFKCGESYLDDEPGIIGGINSENQIEIDERKKVFWDKDPFAFKECKNCKLMPLCLGGCQMKRLIKKQESCSPEYKYTIKELIRHYYESISLN